MEKRNIVHSIGNASSTSTISGTSQTRGCFDRKEELLKWKEEKKLKEAASNAKHAPAFKVGIAPPTTFPKKTLDLSTQYKARPTKFTHPSYSRVVAESKRRKSARLAIVMEKRNISNSSGNNTTSANEAQDSIRRKVQLEKFKHEKKLRERTANAKNVPFKVGIAPPAPRVPAHPSISKAPVGTFDFSKPKLAISTYTYVGPSEPTQQRVTRNMAKLMGPPAPSSEETHVAVPKKKPKGMNFDETYIKYNQFFVTTCTKLSQLSKKWTQLVKSEKLNGNGIPEEYQGEVNVILGSTDQLIQSKMPQFAELLSFYLLKNQDPVPTLANDLEGWWAVGMIQVEKVIKEYEKLDSLQANEWKAKQATTETPKKKTSALKVNENAENIPSKSKGIKGTASSGLKAFLAAKRGNQSKK